MERRPLQILKATLEEDRSVLDTHEDFLDRADVYFTLSQEMRSEIFRKFGKVIGFTALYELLVAGFTENSCLPEVLRKVERQIYDAHENVMGLIRSVKTEAVESYPNATEALGELPSVPFIAEGMRVVVRMFLESETPPTAESNN